MNNIMTNTEMARLYRTASNPRHELNVLHDLTLLPKAEIVRILKSQGCDCKVLEPKPGQKHPRALTDEAIAEIRKMHDNGASDEEIAVALHHRKDTVKKYLKEGKS